MMTNAEKIRAKFDLYRSPKNPGIVMVFNRWVNLRMRGPITIQHMVQPNKTFIAPIHNVDIPNI